MAFSLLIKNARTRFSGGKLVSIGIEGDTIAAVGENLPEAGAAQVIDAEGRLVTESFVNGHLHLCKVYTLEMVGQDALSSYHGGSMGGAMTAIEQASRVKDRYDEKWIIENVRKACRLAQKYGNTHIRAFADTDTKAKLEGVKALIKAREEFKGIVDLQVVAFPQDGVVRDPGAEDYIRKAMELGADVVGGIPWIEYTDADMQEHIDRMFALAKEFNKDVSMLIDDAGDPGLRSLEMLAVKTLKEGWQGRVTAQHCRAMAMYREPYFRKILALLQKASIGLVSDPQTGPLHARVRDLYDSGVAVALGQDDIADAYYPFGRNNMLEVAFLAVHLLWMTTFSDMEIIYDLITTNAAKAMGIRGHVLEPGGNADLVVLNANDVYHAIWEHEAPFRVIRKGQDVTLK
ncbi:MAG TPA: amidohydrolase family protein [Aminivibrio sp.]|jgi:cytosine deaminase|uniref:amidohydrolase family protein n=1 Tax=Aminivibrio sp. TaxID=1872489 RepID=UPI002B2204D1|nr:amidohydrolase family protein [Aminivibrio sp.]MDD3514240.1 amidohydrolase family protein [Synergistaceae bacterium]MEA4952281.1 amidohydrolase family protein [Aminivibrio sp.]NCB15683.1 cytosine deaminase [Synergistales bacterium]HPF86309.1 amidohydrolase family protein [Aminivibrio sp.]